MNRKQSRALKNRGKTSKSKGKACSTHKIDKGRANQYNLFARIGLNIGV